LWKKAHNALYSVLLGGNKMYEDLGQHYWWCSMKKQVANYVSK